ncbi:MAG: MBL fold metallo-hydrolase [Deltaproteobacteria bacterium]|nr:MBL fold metallo-hydrolase [Deltaproteobacteria bacterium]
MKMTLVYDNTLYRKDLQPDWGFACYVEIEKNPTILFDTGTNGAILLRNMEKLGIDPSTPDVVVISHAHWDHTGGLAELMKVNDAAILYVPASFCPSFPGREVIVVRQALQISENIFLTGELMGIEQSLVVKTEKGLVVIAGCSHPGVGPILQAASRYGEVYALIGGLHGFREFDLLKDIQQVCACHCTQHKSEIKRLYPEKWVEGGVGKVIVI